DYLARSMDLGWVRLRRGELGPLPSPEEATEYPYTPHDRLIVDAYRNLAVVGGPLRVRARLTALAAETGANEIMILTLIHDKMARLRSCELVAQALRY